MATKQETVRITDDCEFNAEKFWDNFRSQFPVEASWIMFGASCEMDIATWEEVQKIDGFGDGPSHAPHALIVVSE